MLLNFNTASHIAQRTYKNQS